MLKSELKTCEPNKKIKGSDKIYFEVSNHYSDQQKGPDQHRTPEKLLFGKTGSEGRKQQECGNAQKFKFI